MFRIHDYPLHHFFEELRAKYREHGQDVEFLPFYYNAPFLALVATGTANFTNTTDHDADFIVTQGMQTTFQAGTDTFFQFPNMTVRITADVGGRRLQDRETALVNIFGRGQRAYHWPRPWIIPAKSSWTTTLTNLSAVTNFDTRLTYAGAKAVPRPLR